MELKDMEKKECLCSWLAIGLDNSLEVLIKKAEERNKEEAKHQLEDHVIPFQEQLKISCPDLAIVGAKDILAFDIRRKDWAERVQREARLMRGRLYDRAFLCARKELGRSPLELSQFIKKHIVKP